LLSGHQTAPSALFIPYDTDGAFPASELQRVVRQILSESKHSRVAVMGDADTLEQLPDLDSARLDPEADYQWSGIKVRKGVQKAAKRVVIGIYQEWFQWYMRHQRFRAFQTIVLIEPMAGVSDEEHGGYIDGLLARLAGKVRKVMIISEGRAEASASADEQRAREVIRALLYGTRLTRPEVFQQLSRTFIPFTDSTLAKVFPLYAWRISKDHPRYALDEGDEELLQGMAKSYQHRSGGADGRPAEIEPLFHRRQRFKQEVKLPDNLIIPRALEDAGKFAWVTAPFEAKKLNEWLQELNREMDPRLGRIFDSQERVSDEQWLRLLSPGRSKVRRVLEALVTEGKLKRTTWYRELGRPAFAYSPPDKVPFLKSRCGQCAFYVPVKRRCSLWHLANSRAVFYHPKWRQLGSKVTEFEIHKMRFASRIGPHSSACQRFVDKKRDHLRKSVPERCEVCGETMPRAERGSMTCRRCTTRYAWAYIWSKKSNRFERRVRVMTSYTHEFSRIYHEATGDDATADLEAYRREVKENIQTRQAGLQKAEDIEDALAERAEVVSEPEQKPPEYSGVLQEKVDRLSQTTDIARQLSVAMAQSALAATKRLVAFANVYRGDAEPLMVRQERYLALIKDADHSKLLPYEAQVMKQYWLCYGLALRGVPEIWLGPRKRSRFVRESVGDPSGRARGYSPMDAAINYLHQRRLRQAERINQEVGFPGACDGFLHKEQYNSRKIGLLLDMIDPFKFADREELLLVCLNRGLTWREFRIEKDRRGSSFYYPMAPAISKLDQAGMAADALVVRQQGIGTRLTEAYEKLATDLLQTIQSGEEAAEFNPFVFEVETP
jgi:CRISPR/Cas system-associated endonuclease Cas1